MRNTIRLTRSRRQVALLSGTSGRRAVADTVASMAWISVWVTVVCELQYGSCLEKKKLGVGLNFLSYRVFGGYGGGYGGGTSRFAVGGRRD